MIVPLHNHSEYSALDGYATPEEIADRCLEIGCPCCGLTDHGVVSGHLHFGKALEAKGIQPIFGCELYHGTKTTFKGKERDQAHLIALAQTDKGLANLWSLVNATSDEAHFHNVGRVFWEDIEKYHEDIIFTSACALGLVPQSIIRDDYSILNRYLDIIGDNFYIEIHTYPIDIPFKDRDFDGGLNMQIINEALVAIAQERGIPLVYASDAHYAFPSQAEMHDMYIALQTRQSVYTPVEDRSMWHPPGALAIADEDMVRKALDYLPEYVVDEAIANSVAIAESVTAKLPGYERHLPMFVPSECPWLEDDSKALSADELFIDLVEAGILEKYGENAAQEVWDRTLYEVETLLRDGIHHYFLMGWDEVQIAKETGTEMGPGRGSSAGCITAYALGITDVDPLHYGLIFERFWNSGRAKGFPDIDSDFSRRGRDKVIAALKERWGADKVQAIGTTGYMKPKAVCDKLFKGFDLDFTENEEIKEIVGRTTKIEILGHNQIGWNPELEPGKVYYVKNDVGAEIEKWVAAANTPRRRAFIDACEQCCSRVQQYGVHASGIAIAEIPLASRLPAYRRGGKQGVPATMFTMKDVDKLGFIKLDVLGLRTLDVLEYWRQMMSEQGIDIVWSGLDKEEHPDEMWQMLHDGFTAGIFQVEDGYGRQLCKSLQPTSVLDLSVIGALIRPGPAQAGIPDMYMRRKTGIDPVTYHSARLEEILAPILNETYGLFVYQEQIIAYFNSLGYTLSESDAMRKIMGKKEPELLDPISRGTGEWDGRGYFEMASQAGLSDDTAENVWITLEGFADYCFNKSHTVAYGIIGLRELYAKYYGAAEFYASCMRSFDLNTEKQQKMDAKLKKKMVPQFVNEARRLGIEVKPPHIMESRSYSHVSSNGTWYLGFEDVHGVGHSGEYIVALRDAIDVSSPESFAESFEAHNKQFLDDQKARKKAGELVEKVKSPKQELQANKIGALTRVGAWQEICPDGRTMTEQQNIEEELLGVILTDNTDEVMARNAQQIQLTDRVSEVLTPWFEKRDTDDMDYIEYNVCGIVTNVQEKRSTKTGKPFGIITIDCEGGQQIEFMVFSHKWKSHKFLFRLRTPGIFTLRHQPPNDYGESYLFERGQKLK